jgi:hypothetical protein
LNSDEEIVNKYLQTNVGGEIVHEPDGKNPPDFSIDSSIAIEVRRLNAHYFLSQKIKSIEAMDIPVRKKFNRIIKNLPIEYQGKSYFVGFCLNHPIKSFDTETIKGMKKILENYLSTSDADTHINFRVNSKITLNIDPADPKTGKPLFPGGMINHSEGGFIIPIYFENINHCIDEKNKKIDNYKQKYNEWWLILVDHLCNDLEASDIEQIKNNIGDLGNFCKLIIITKDNFELLTQYQVIT